MAKRPISQSQANAYKAKAEGKAALVTAWMPLIRLVAGAVITYAAWKLGMDLKPLTDVISALKN